LSWSLAPFTLVPRRWRLALAVGNVLTVGTDVAADSLVAGTVSAFDTLH
jgi:hypothetical protein